MITASSPGKIILFGEHAVVYGKPAIALCIDRRIRLSIRPSSDFRVDGGPLKMRRHRYVRWAVRNLWDGPPISIKTRSSLPSASGLGSSAALSCSVVAGLMASKGGVSEEILARRAFEVEYNVQGGASPTDTSCSAHGSGILVSEEAGDSVLWSIEKGDKKWFINHLDVPKLCLVVGYTKIPSVTHLQVRKVRSFYDRSGFARETIDEIGDLVLEGSKALEKGNLAEIGRLMDRNHSLLSILGVNSKHLDKLRDAALPHSYGAKLTGAGGGGSVIALTDEPDRVSRSIKRRGGVPYVVAPSVIGTEAEGELTGDETRKEK